MCRASKRGEDQPDIICAGLAQKSTSKAEDVCAVTITNDWSIAAVFDGHGGKIAAERCKNELVPTLLEKARSDWSTIDAAIADACWEIDESMGMEGIDDGTTATVGLFEQKKGKLEGLIAWIGDSTALRVDMTAKTEAGVLVPGSTTADHVPSNKSEVHRLQLQWVVRQQIEQERERAAEEGISPMSTMTTDERLSHGSEMSVVAAHMPPDDEEVQRAVRALGHEELNSDDLALMVRALAREKQMELRNGKCKPARFASPCLTLALPLTLPLALTLAQFSFIPNLYLTLLLPYPHRSPAATERRSYIGVHRDSRRLCSPAASGGGRPVSLAMTRSIGDWDASRAMVALHVENARGTKALARHGCLLSGRSRPTSRARARGTARCDARSYSVAGASPRDTAF